MKQLGLSIPLFIKKPRVTRRQKFLEEMEQVVPCAEWTNRIAPHYPVAGLGRKPFALEAILRIHMLNNDLVIQILRWKKLYMMSVLLEFAGLDAGKESCLMKRRSSNFVTCWRSITWHITEMTAHFRA